VETGQKGDHNPPAGGREGLEVLQILGRKTGFGIFQTEQEQRRAATVEIAQTRLVIALRGEEPAQALVKGLGA